MLAQPRRILFVDDDIFYAQNYFARLLRDHIDCELTTLDNVSEAIQAIDTKAFDVIVLDLMMPPGAMGE